MPVDFERHDSVAVLTLNRPEALNAMSPEMLDGLMELLDAIEADDTLRAIVLTGAGEKAFCAGADIAHMTTASPHEARAYAQRGQALADRIEDLATPVLAAVNGYALGGGCELALACDLRIASERARFGQPEITLGILPGWGGTQRLARATSPGLAKEMILTGRPIDAATALRAGLVTHVHPPEELMQKALDLAGALAAQPIWASAAAKRLCNAALDGDLHANLQREIDQFALAFTTTDQREGMSAFVEKRKPAFATTAAAARGEES